VPDATPCLVPSCERDAQKRGWCKPHYLRWWRYGDPLAGRGIVQGRQPQECAVDGCARSDIKGQRLCGAHYQRWLKSGNPGEAEVEARRKGATCEIDGCSGKHYGRGLCEKHYQRWVSHGDADTVLPGPWKGDDAGYSAVHERLVTARGPARQHVCAHCGQPAMDWAYDHLDPDEKVGLRHGRLLAYSTDPDRYMPLCRLCHSRHDSSHNVGPVPIAG
jgi:hypothetical protein